MKEINYIRLEQIVISGRMVRYTFTTNRALQRYFTGSELWVEYDVDMSAIPLSILAISFVGTYISAAWLLDARMIVPTLDETFYRAMPRLRDAYRELYPDTPLRGMLVVGDIVSNKMPSKAGNPLLLFSGGIDCQATYIRNIDKQPSLCNIQGWYWHPEDSSKAAEAELHDVSAFAAQQGVKGLTIRSNFATLPSKKLSDLCLKHHTYQYWYSFLHSMAFISIAIPRAWQLDAQETIIASSFHLHILDVCASYATTDSEFRFAELGHVRHDSFDIFRQQKVSIIVDHQRHLGQPWPLKVCSFNDHNCLTCEKCLRSVAGIVAEGADPRDFGFNFDKGSIAPFYKGYFGDAKNLALSDVQTQINIHYKYIRERMRENYSAIQDKEFADWFMNWDIAHDRRKAIWKYRRKYLFQILKRKLSR